MINSRKPASWCVVCTSKAFDLQVEVLVAHHLNMGAESIFLYVETEPKSGPPLDTRVKLTVTNDNYWKVLGGRPEDHRARQVRNANHALQSCDSSFIAHIDSDELIYAEERLDLILGALPENCPGIQIQPCEPCYSRTPDTEADIYACSFRKCFEFGRAGDLRALKVFGAAGRILHRGLQGHGVGKFIVRTNLLHLRLDLHWARCKGMPVSCRKDERVLLLHFFAVTLRIGTRNTSADYAPTGFLMKSLGAFGNGPCFSALGTNGSCSHCMANLTCRVRDNSADCEGRGSLFSQSSGSQRLSSVFLQDLAKSLLRKSMLLTAIQHWFA